MKSTDSSFGKRIIYRESKCISKVSVCSSKKYTSMKEVVQCHQPANMLAHRPVEWCHTGDSMLDFAAEDWAEVGFGEWKSVLLSPCITSIPAIMVTLFMSPLSHDKGG